MHIHSINQPHLTLHTLNKTLQPRTFKPPYNQYTCIYIHCIFIHHTTLYPVGVCLLRDVRAHTTTTTNGCQTLSFIHCFIHPLCMPSLSPLITADTLLSLVSLSLYHLLITPSLLYTYTLYTLLYEYIYIYHGVIQQRV
jgi:hypothetical protein